MKIWHLLASLLIINLFVGCGNPRSKYAGTWTSGQAGFLSVQLVLDLNKDGSAAFSGGNMWASSSEDNLFWRVKGDQIFMKEGKDGEEEAMEIVSFSKDEMVVKMPGMGLVTYKKAGK